MSSSNNALRVADLDFFSIRENLKTYLRSQSTFTDYDFEGSGMSVLLDLLAYNTYYNSFYMNMIANEAFLDTAQIRQNILSHAKAINYVPGSAQGGTNEINITVTPAPNEDSNTSFIVLEKYTKLLGADVDGVNYPFVTLNANTSYKDNGVFSFANVVIKQGEPITHQYPVSANNLHRRYEIPSANVDLSTLAVTVQESSTNTYSTYYTQSTDITEVRGNSAVYFVEENENLNYTVYFGDNVIGRAPSNGQIVVITYLDTLGSRTNNITKFIFTDPIAGLYSSNVLVSASQGSYGAVDKETVDQIRFKAPNFYTAQNRAVTTGDYETLITKDYRNVEAVTVWGGEDNDPPVYGKVYMSLKTKGYYTLTNLEKENIKDSLIRSRNMMTVVPEIVDPVYVFVMIRGSVQYDPKLTSKSQTQLLQLVRDAVFNYANKELYTFKSTFRKSKIQQYIEAADPAITGSDIDIYFQIRQKMGIGEAYKYVIPFNTSLRKGDYFQKLYSYPQLRVLDAKGTTREIFYEEIPESFTGVDSIEITNPGYNYESTPTVTITGDGSGATAEAVVVRGRLTQINVINAGINYTRAFCTITGDGFEGEAVVRLKSNFGTLRTYYFKDNGEKVFVNEAAGTVNYLTGRVELNTVRPVSMPDNPFYDQDVLTINVVPDSEVIPPLRNRIFAIDTNNAQCIQLELVPEA